MFSSRLENGAWRLCERGGRTILCVFDGGPEIAFARRADAQKCSAALNELWDLYKDKRRETEGWETQQRLLEIIRQHGGIGEEVWEALYGE